MNKITKSPSPYTNLSDITILLDMESDEIQNNGVNDKRNSKPIEKNNTRTIHAWAMFDWANSSYALVIAVAIFPIYFNGILEDNFILLGMKMTNTALFSYALAFAYLIISLALPLLSGIADYGGRKLSFMRFFTTLGALACIGLFWFKNDLHPEPISQTRILIGVVGFVLAVIGFAGGQVFYNSYLPLIATEDRFDKVSAKGFAYGYVGSVLLLIANIVMVQKPQWFGMNDAAFASRVSFVMVGLWWIGFAQITFNRMPKETRVPFSSKLMKRGYEEIRSVWHKVKDLRNLKYFLVSFFFYSAGVQTVIYLASTFATDELKFEAAELILVILILQLVAIAGAYFFAFVSSKTSNKISLLIMLVIWICICIMAYFVTAKFQFYIIAALVGLVMGGVQSMSRSTYSKLIPAKTEDTASFFSFYDVLEKVAIVMGTFSFGLIEQLFGGMRNSVLALTIYFLIGIILLALVKMKPKDASEAPMIPV